jgi:hypothetical protein
MFSISDSSDCSAASMSSTRQGTSCSLSILPPVEQEIERAQTAATGCNVEHPLFLGRDYDQVLQQALGLDAGGEFLDEEVAVVLADIGLGKPSLPSGIIWMSFIMVLLRPEWPSPSAQPLPAPLPSRFQDA